MVARAIISSCSEETLNSTHGCIVYATAEAEPMSRTREYSNIRHVCCKVTPFFNKTSKEVARQKVGGCSGLLKIENWVPLLFVMSIVVGMICRHHANGFLFWYFVPKSRRCGTTID